VGLHQDAIDIVDVDGLAGGAQALALVVRSRAKKLRQIASFILGN
jgi:hypothetical protein